MLEISLVYPNGILVCSNTEKYGDGEGDIGISADLVLRILKQYLLMGTSKIDTQDTRRDRTKPYGKHHPSVGECGPGHNVCLGKV